LEGQPLTDIVRIIPMPKAIPEAQGPARHDWKYYQRWTHAWLDEKPQDWSDSAPVHPESADQKLTDDYAKFLMATELCKLDKSQVERSEFHKYLGQARPP